MVRLGDIAKITKGTKVEQIDRSLGTIRFLQIGDLRNDNCIKWCDPSDKYTQTTPDDVVIAWDGANAGTIGYGLSGVIGSTLAKISFNRPLVSEYIGLYLQGKFTYLQETCNGATIPHINRKALDKLQLPLPPLAEQKRIADVLDTASGLIKKRIEQIRLIDQLAKSLFVEMFGDPVENPMGWEERQLLELSEITSGLTKGRKTSENNLINIPYMRVANVKDGHIDLSEIKTIAATKEEITRYILQKGDVLLTEGGDRDKLGRGAIWNGALSECIHQNHIFRVRTLSMIMNPVYFAEYLKYSKAKNYFLRAAKQTTGIASINMTQLRSLPVLLPPLPLQQEFADRIDAIEEQKALFETGLEKLEMNYRALMQEYFG